MNHHISSWPIAPPQPQLTADAIHIWLVNLNQIAAADYQQLNHYLNDDEQARAARFVYERDRNHFIAARGILREILSRYIVVDPINLQFSYSEKGKPALNLSTSPQPLHFNLSHAHGMAIYAITRINSIGIDIEYNGRQIKDLEIAERFFAKEEISALKQLPLEQQQAGFYTIWTRKEAFIKALGTGLSYPLDQFAVNIDSDKAALINVHNDASAMNEWSLVNIAIDENYKAALAIAAKEFNVQQWYWAIRND